MLTIHLIRVRDLPLQVLKLVCQTNCTHDSPRLLWCAARNRKKLIAAAITFAKSRLAESCHKFTNGLRTWWATHTFAPNHNARRDHKFCRHAEDER